MGFYRNLIFKEGNTCEHFQGGVLHANMCRTFGFEGPNLCPETFSNLKQNGDKLLQMVFAGI